MIYIKRKLFIRDKMTSLNNNGNIYYYNIANCNNTVWKDAIIRSINKIDIIPKSERYKFPISLNLFLKYIKVTNLK